ncbi:hypothetical protein UFOVP594_22 [uncultured Caudovirales phage]|uniref:Uncharacterized protein n=1 Tax=uncultured Caudovirales phage TaxID=2100421 RepID=A0A6J5MWB8_9CAUD|nr:hypothetical protein UFOVP594_22 [uncultured Caudovirales phage]
MIKLKVTVQGLDELRQNFAKSPQTTLKYLQHATANAIFEVENQAVDRNFQFITPRTLRTGMLQRSFDFGRWFSPDGLSASIGPTVQYAADVYFGRSGGRANYYMDRIARAASTKVQKHFQDAVDVIVDTLAKI